MLKSKQVKVPEDCDSERFDIAAAKLFEGVSRKKIKIIIDAGGAYINKKRVSFAKNIVKQGDKLEIYWEEKNVIPENSSTNSVHIKNHKKDSINKETIIFEHEDFFVINKPAGIASQATLDSTKDSILEALSLFNKEKFKQENMFLVHRLDKETSGLMIIAKNKKTQSIFEESFRDKKIQKKYIAICYNVPKKQQGIIDFPIAKDKFRKNCYLTVNTKSAKFTDAKNAETEYQTKNIFGKNEASLIECFPKTGRTHQIRVHLAAIGCPLLGDKTYAQNMYGHKFLQLALRHMLHAECLTFRYLDKDYEFHAPIPEDFQTIIKTIESYK